nr:sulfatase-like hydrolase/transferase [Prevotella sp.]
YDEKGNWSMNTKRYAALVTHMDYNIGRVIGAINQLGLRENTIIIFASDNGAAVMAPMKDLNCGAGLKGHKGQLYEGGIKVPVIVNQPGKVPAGKVNNIIYFPDFMSAFASITNAKKYLPQHIDGMDISPLFYGKKIDTDNRYLYWEFPGKQKAIRFGKWKAESIGKNKPIELYNIESDPYEKTNLAEKEPKLLKQLEKKMKEMHEPSPYWPLPGE